MKKTFLVLILIILVCSHQTLISASKTYTNPVNPGFFPDPSTVRVRNDYYTVNSTFEYFPGIIISHSKDLVNWKQIDHVFNKSAELDLRHFFDGMGT